MSNTIELLQAIGGDASLRHANGQDLARTLAGMQASKELQQAAASGDSAPLAQELGYRKLDVVKSPTQTGFEDDENDSDEMPVPPDQDGRESCTP